MTQHENRYAIVPYAKMRRASSATMRAFQRKPMMHGLLEVDVTRARELLREHKASTGESLSFTAFVITCLGKALDEDKSLQAYRWGRKRLVVFDDVDVALAVEREVAGEMVPLVYVVRAVNHKTVRDVHREIRAYQAQGVSKSLLGFATVPFMPASLFVKILYRLLRTFPWLHKRVVGTVGVTSVGMFGRGTGWGIPVAGDTLLMTLGGLATKPGVVDGRIAIREYLCVTLSFDHRIVNGAPAARFAVRLGELIQSGYGLDGVVAELRPPAASGTPETQRSGS